jgi:hypothetical protein
MVSEVIDHRHAPDLPPHFLPARSAFETRERRLDHFRAEAVEARRSRGHRCVAHVKFPNEWKLKWSFPQSEMGSM